MNTVALWVGFNLFVVFLLILDLGVFHRRAHEVKVREALVWSGIWIILALLFNLFIYFTRGGEVAVQYLTGYLIEKSLSIDNIFVFIIVFSYFNVPAKYQHRVLFWGIIGALVMRAILIVLGATLIDRFHWIIFIFGGFLIFTGIKMALEKGAKVNPENNPLVRLFKKILPLTGEYHGARFFIRQEGRRLATPLFIVLIVIETTDLIFAVDSIPAIFAVTRDPFIVYTSNVFAILGLRSLYFALAGVMNLFRYLKYGLAAVLVFVGIKMIVADFYKFPALLALAIVAGLLGAAVLASIITARKENSPPENKPSPDD